MKLPFYLCRARHGAALHDAMELRDDPQERARRAAQAAPQARRRRKRRAALGRTPAHLRLHDTRLRHTSPTTPATSPPPTSCSSRCSLVYFAIMAIRLSRLERDAGRAQRAGRPRAGQGARRGMTRPNAELLVLGISHKTAPVALRERLALTEREAERFVRSWSPTRSSTRPSRSRPATAPRSTWSCADPVRPRPSCSERSPGAPDIRPDRARRASSTRRATATPRASCTG